VRFSPDGAHVRFAQRASDVISYTLWDVTVDGTGLHALLPERFHQDPGECCGHWSADGRYFFFRLFATDGPTSGRFAKSGDSFVGEQRSRCPLPPVHFPTTASLRL
jgi:hypothetical protein